MLYVIATCKPLLLLLLLFIIFILIFYLKIYQNMGQKLGSNNSICVLIYQWILSIFISNSIFLNFNI
jgi:hypothetical protein